jgi:hypothetical protein
MIAGSFLMNYESISLLCSSHLEYDFMRLNVSSIDGKHEGFPTVGILTQTKKLALRQGIWFRILSRIERGVIDLTVKYVNNIKSAKLAKVVTAIMEKLQSAMESIVDKLVRTVGLPLARKISNIAVSWGNNLASRWADDRSFARFLVVNFGTA